MAKESNAQIKIDTIAKRVYAGRKSRAVHPEGEFDKQMRWYPSTRENADGFSIGLRRPSSAWPYSYMLGARTLKHCKALVEIGLQGGNTPADVFVEVKRFEAQEAAAAVRPIVDLGNVFCDIVALIRYGFRAPLCDLHPEFLVDRDRACELWPEVAAVCEREYAVAAE